MPYIKNEDYSTAKTQPDTPGELNYAITMLMIEYLTREGLSYANAAETIAAATEAAAEFRRRVLVPYENEKIAENGDVYPTHLLINTFHARMDGD